MQAFVDKKGNIMMGLRNFNFTLQLIGWIEVLAPIVFIDDIFEFQLKEIIA